MLKTILFLILLLSGLADVHAQDETTDSLIGELTKAKADTNKVNLLKKIGTTYANQDPRKAIDYWKQAIVLSKTLNFDIGLARNYINIGTGYSYLGKFDSTLIYADSGIIYSKKGNDPDRLALVYLNKGDAYRNLENFSAALLYCDTAATYASKTTNTDRLARIYDITSSIYVIQGLFPQSKSYLIKAMDLYRKNDNKLMISQCYDDYAYLCVAAGNNDSALIYVKMSIKMAEEIQDLNNLSSYYYTAAKISMELKKLSDAETYSLKSLQYAKQQENDIQLATSYGLLGEVYIKQEKYVQAVGAGKLAYQYAIVAEHITWQREAASILAKAYVNTNDYKNAYKFLDISNTLNDSITKQHFNEQTAQLQNSFEIKEKDKEILLLNKSKELQQQKLYRQRILIIGAIIFAVLLLIGVALLISRSKLHSRMKELEFRNRIAADLHDEVGSSLSSIHMLSQMITTKEETTEKEKNILQKMSSNAKETMEKMGDIVWMIKPGESESGSLKQRMERFAYEICSSKNIEVNLHLTDLEQVKLTVEQRKNIYLIFKEAINNAVKYSGTQKIEVTVARDKYLSLVIKDNGNGFDTTAVKKGNGLENMAMRAKEIKGEINIVSAEGNGTIIQLDIPV